MEQLIMIKYGELTTKKANRNFFVNTLENNIKAILDGVNYKIIKDRVRMYIESDDIPVIVEKLSKIFGIHGIVIAHKVNNNVEEIKEKVLEIIDTTAKTFKINTKRAFKEFPIPSMEFNNIIGGFVLKNTA